MTGDFYYVTCANKPKVSLHKISRDDKLRADRDGMRSDMFSTARKQYQSASSVCAPRTCYCAYLANPISHVHYDAYCLSGQGASASAAT